MNRSTPRVRWNLSSVDQSPKSRSNSSGWIGYDSSMRRRYSASLTPDGNSRPSVRYISLNALMTPSRTLAFSDGIGSNKRRRTISNDSSGDAGCHCAALRVTTFFSFSNAARPRSPPTSMSEAGIEINSTTFGTAAAASVSAWANVNCVSKSPPARRSPVPPSRSCRAYATHSSISTTAGPHCSNSVFSAPPGLVPASSSVRTNSYASRPPSW